MMIDINDGFVQEISRLNPSIRRQHSMIRSADDFPVVGSPHLDNGSTLPCLAATVIVPPLSADRADFPGGADKVPDRHMAASGFHERITMQTMVFLIRINIVGPGFIPLQRRYGAEEVDAVFHDP